MTTVLKKTIRDSKSARWIALIIVSFTMMWGYFLTDAMSPLMDMLGVSIEQGGMDWSAKDFGWFNNAYMWLNVFFLMLIFGGIILDKVGVRLTGLVSCVFMVVGAGIKYYAVEYIAPGGEAVVSIDWLGLELNKQVLVACIGYALFAVGTENCGITVSKVIVKWFTGYELALAMGVQVAVARLGTAVALAINPIIVSNFSMSTPLLLALVLLVVGLMAYIVFCVMDKKLDKQAAEDKTENDEDTFKVSDLKLILTNKGFWLIALLCLCFYSAVFPFMKYASSLMINKYNVDSYWAGLLPALIPFGNLFMTPLFGRIYDKYGKGATIMMIGSVLLILVHVLFALPVLNYWWFAAFIMLLLGVAFSLVPSAMWPSMPKIVPLKLLGSAYALTFWIQNIGLGGVPLLIGIVLENYCTNGTVIRDGVELDQYDYTIPMCIFAVFGIIALILAFLLLREDKKKHYGLQEANIKK
ncbi:MAG: MFS transporter [Bacteroidales bacterium]|nr:MFS transporter [Candidatus Minthousia equi]MDO4956154.1 MFS transporter [Bacteroidales bacterium]